MGFHGKMYFTKMIDIETLLEGLNDKQKEAVTYKEGPLLVLAGAGSGKTKVLTHRAAWFMATGMAGPHNILLLTFTNKAAKEMKERIESLVGTTLSMSGTFHSFCVKLLRQDGLGIGIDRNFVIYDDNDQKDVIKDILEELNLPQESCNPGAIANQISEAKSNSLTPGLYSELAVSDFQQKVYAIWNKYEKILKEANALDFDDLLVKAVDLLGKKEVREKWQSILTHILVDEWQDTNKLQYQLTKLLVGKDKNLTAVGDASQSIYSWRGADYRNITNLAKDYPDIKIVNLEQNYRSTQNILDAANAIISKNTAHPILSLWTQNSGGESIKVYAAKSGFDEASFLVEEISSLSRQGYSLGDFAILYRTNAQSRVIEEAFLHAGIPYTLVGGTKFYARSEIKDVLSYLRLLINPKDGVSEKRVKKIGVKKYEKFEEFKKTINNFEEITTLQIMDEMLLKTGYLEKYQKTLPTSKIAEENFQKLENIKELRSVASQFPDIYEFLASVALVETQQDSSGKITAQEGRQEKVTLMTLHSAKGLEFPVVFMVGMEEGLFPHSRSLFDKTQMEEERRLAYVGTTRAKEILFLSYAFSRLYFGQKLSNPPSRFIIDIPEHLVIDARMGGRKKYYDFEAEGY
jgi:DNA helicase-2/ATP-dependent DNA helicase PcrA